MISNIQDIDACPDCASTNIVHSMARDQVICRDCGLIFEPLAPALDEPFEKAHGMSSVPKAAKKTKATRKTKKKVKKTKKKAKKKTKKKTAKKAKKKTKKRAAKRAKKTRKRR